MSRLTKAAMAALAALAAGTEKGLRSKAQPQAPIEAKEVAEDVEAQGNTLMDRAARAFNHQQAYAANLSKMEIIAELKRKGRGGEVPIEYDV